MKVFDDTASFVHPVLGYLSKSTPIGTLIMLGFVGYQLLEKEPMANKLGDFVEFGVGYAAASLVQK